MNKKELMFVSFVSVFLMSSVNLLAMNNFVYYNAELGPVNVSSRDDHDVVAELGPVNVSSREDHNVVAELHPVGVSSNNNRNRRNLVAVPDGYDYPIRIIIICSICWATGTVCGICSLFVGLYVLLPLIYLLVA